MITIHGIGNCDTCRKARKWFDEKGIDHEWVDLRDPGVDRATLAGWLEQVGADRLINRRSATWRKLPEDLKAAAVQGDAVAVLEDYTTLIKRPVFEAGGQVRVGFDDTTRGWIGKGLRAT